MSAPTVANIIADADGTPLTIGREAATELGVAALQHLENRPCDADVRALTTYAARHHESAPARDALVAILLNASGTLPASLAARARGEVQRAAWGPSRESAGLANDPQVSAVPRRQALSERLLAERARRLRPQMHALIMALLAADTELPVVPSWFLERNWVDLRDTLVQRVRSEPMHREAIARWVAAQHPAVRTWLQVIEDALIDVATQAILHTPQRAPLEPYCGDDRVAQGVRTAVGFRGEYARMRLAGYLERLTPGTQWYETIRSIADARPPDGAR